jgi:hypothetical protein
MGIYHNEASVMSVASDLVPAARSAASTHNAEQGRGRASGSGGAMGGSNFEAFGPVAMSATSTGARAVSASHSIALVANHKESEAAHGASSAVFEQGYLRTGAGRSQVFTDSMGVTERAPTASAISNVGGGPVAIAEANEAVALANADTPRNDRGITRRLAWRAGAGGASAPLRAAGGARARFAAARRRQHGARTGGPAAGGGAF